jgi:hypothetical protein
MRMGGVIIVSDPDLPQDVEIPTFTCPHCGCVGRVTSEMGHGISAFDMPLFDPTKGTPNDDGGFCFTCKALICRKQACGDHVEPYFQRMGFGY